MRMNWFSIDQAYILVEITNAGSANYHDVVWSVMYFLSDLSILKRLAEFMKGYNDCWVS